MIYLDNAATSFPKPRSVIREVTRCIKVYCGNPSRSSHVLAIRAAEEVYLAREAVAEFFGSENPERVVFTTNTTYALNIAIKCLLKPPCHVLISDIEHNSVLRPIIKASREKGISYSVFSTQGNVYENIEKSLGENTTAIITTLASNVTGEIIEPQTISKIAQKYGLISIIDAAQAAGHFALNVKATPFSAVCAPAHKGLLGIQGCGFVLFGDVLPSETLIEGGSGAASLSEKMPEMLPEMLEAGTLPTPSIVSLRHGIRFINHIGIKGIEEKMLMLTELYRERLESFGEIEIFGGNAGIISFRKRGERSHVLADKLNGQGICVRSGLQCAPSIHRRLGTVDTGLVRISLSPLSKAKEADIFYKALKKTL